jgi:hypothetical protein
MTQEPPRVEVVVRSASGEAPGRVDGKSVAWWRASTREALGLPSGPCVGTGHQSACWHPGILAKHLWAADAAAREGGSMLHLVVDQDGFDGMLVEWPARASDGMWSVRGHRFAEDGGQTAACRCPSARPRAADAGEGAPPEVAEGLARIAAALDSHVAAPNAAMQGAAAMLELARPWTGMCTTVAASRILQAGFGRWLLDRMIADPAACARAFNAALARAPRAARALRLAGDRSELPVWVLGPTGERMRADAADVRGAIDSGAPVLPRAFPMSVIARTALTDRFVHGLGGGVYEQATDHWMQAWLGWTPPPHDVVSASLRLDMPIPEGAAVAVMPWRRAWCDPELLQARGAGPSPARRHLLDRIAALPVGDPGRRRAYRDLIEARNAGRVARAMELESLRQAELVAARARQSRELAARRTWCFALHPPEAISRLQAALREVH